MRFEHDGMFLWFEPDEHVKSGTVQAGSDVSLTVGVEPADASNRVEILYRVNGGPTATVATDPVRHAGNVQYFRAHFPSAAFRVGDRMEYTAVCRCAGRQVPSAHEAEPFSSSFRVVDAATTQVPVHAPSNLPARGLNTESRLISSISKPDFIVYGQVQGQKGQPLPGVTVRTLDRDLPSLERRAGSVLQMLGEAIADAEGRFQITYTIEQFQSGEGISTFRRLREKNADLSFRLFDRAGQELVIRSIRALDREFRGDQVIFNAPTPIEVSILIDAAGEAGASEYEQLLALLAPVVDGLALDALADEDIAFLSNELGLDGQAEALQRVDWLRWSAALVQETRLSAPAFYGWARTGLPPELWARLEGYDDPQRRSEAMTKLLELLAATDEEALAAHLVRAAEGRIIPANFRERAGAIAAAIRRRALAEVTLRLRLERDPTREALAGYTVTTFDADANNRDLGTDLTNALGEFEVAVHVDAATPDAARKLRFRIRSPDMAEPVEVSQRVVATDGAAGEGATIPVSVGLPARGPTLQQLRAGGHLEVTEDVLQLLQQQHGIQSLADIRRRGGLSRIAALRALDASATRRLDALADLERLSGDPNEMALLLDHRYDSVAAIADTPRGEFLATLAAGRADGTGRATIGARRAAELHVMAQAQSDLFKQLFAGIAADFSSGIRPSSGVAAGDYFSPFPPEPEYG